MLKKQITKLLKDYPITRNSDHELRRYYYWNHLNAECRDIDGKMYISAEAMRIVDPESIRRTRQKIQEEAKRLVAEGKEQYAELLADEQVAEVRGMNAEKIAKAFGGNIDSVL